MDSNDLDSGALGMFQPPELSPEEQLAQKNKKDWVQKYNDWINNFTLPGVGNVANTAGNVGAGIGAGVDLATGNAPEGETLAKWLKSSTPNAQPGPAETMLRGIASGVPRGMVDTTLLASGIGAPLGAADAFAQGYAANKSPLAGAINAATLGAGVKYLPKIGAAAENVYLRSALPAAEQVAKLPSVAYGSQIADLVTKEATRGQLARAALNRVGAEGLTGTGGFLASNELTSAAEGKGFHVPTVPEVIGTGLQQFMFSPLEVAHIMKAPTSLVEATSRGVEPPAATLAGMKVAEEAGRIRAQNAQVNMQRGERLADIHNNIFEAIKQGQEPDLTGLNAEYSDAVNQRAMETATQGDPRMLFTQAADDANAGKLSSQQMGDILAGVMGRLDERAAKSDSPMDISAAAYQQLVDQGHMPRLDESFLQTNMPEAFDKALGDEHLGMVNLMNRVHQWIQEKVPEALQARAANPVADKTLTKYSFDMADEMDRDRQYVDALRRLEPNMRGKLGPSGKPLFDELQDQDVRVQRATGDRQFTATHEWDQYANWRDTVTQMANTFDPVTQTGQVAVRRRMGDGRVAYGPPKTRTLEEIVSPDYYIPSQRVTRARGGKSTMEVEAPTSSVGDMFEYFQQKEAHEQWQNAEEDPLAAGETLSTEGPMGKSPKLSGVAGGTENLAEPVVEKTAGQAHLDLMEQAMAGDDNKMHDAGLLIATKVEKSTGDELWRQAGMTMFGEKAGPEKIALFKQALMAKLEHMMDPEGHNLTQAGQDFVKATMESRKAARPNVSEERLGQRLAGKAPREQVSHLLGDYFKGVRTEDMKQAMIGLLDGQPKYQEYLDSLDKVGNVLKTMRFESTDQGGWTSVTPESFNNILMSKVTVAKDGTIPGQMVENLMKRAGAGSDELAYYKSRGLDKFMTGRANVKELQTFLDENRLQTEVKKLSPDNAVVATSDTSRNAQHFLETRGYELRDIGGSVDLYKDGNVVDYSKLPNDINEAYMGFVDAGFDSKTDAATGKYGVEPKRLDQMPGAVDILVRVPQRPDTFNKKGERNIMTPKEKGVMFTGPHFGDSDVNVVASLRGYMETLPTGEKVFHVFEVQSDWGQKMRGADTRHVIGSNTVERGHPLLSHYETLALKTAIQHARENGATKIAISDADTAMMTEGHDRNSQFAPEDPDSRLGVGKISQEPGMRAAYDQRLPAIMQKLTGQSGEPVDFGEHKSATQGGGFGEDGGMSIPEGSPVFKDLSGKPKTQVTARLYDLGVVHKTGPLIVTVQEMAGKRSVQVDVPGATPDSRPVFSGTPEDATKAGYDTKIPFDLPVGKHVLDDSTKPIAPAVRGADWPHLITGEPMEQWTMTEDVPGHPELSKGSTLNRESIEKAGFRLPSGPEDAGISGGQTYAARGFSDPKLDTARIFTNWALRSGYGPVFAAEFGKLATRMTAAFPEVSAVGTLKDLAEPDLGAAIAKTFSQFQTWGINMDTAKGITALVNFAAVPKDNIDRAASTFRFLQVLAHELTHAYTGRDFSASNSLFARQRQDKYNVMLNLFKGIGPEQSETLLNKVMFEILVPEQFRGDATQGKAGTPEEAVSRLMEYVAVGAFAHGTGLPHTPAENFLDAVQHVPDEVYNFMQMAYRDIADYAGASKDFYKQSVKADMTPEGRAAAAKTGAVFDSLIKHAQEFLGDAPNREENRLIAQNVINGLVAGGTRDWTDPIVVIAAHNQGQKDIVAWGKANNINFTGPEVKKALETARETQMTLFGSEPAVATDMDKRALGTTTPMWSKWMGMLKQHLTDYERLNNPIAAPMAWTIQQLGPSYQRLTKMMREPFMTLKPNGRWAFDPDHPVQEILQMKTAEAGPARIAISDIMRQANESQVNPVVRQPDGTVSLSDFAKEKLSRFSARTQQGMVAGIEGLYKAYKTAADLIYTSEVERSVHRTATNLMRLDRGMQYEPAYTTARKIVTTAIDVLKSAKDLKEAVEQGLDPTVQQMKAAQTQAQYAAAFQGTHVDARANFESYAFGNDGVVPKLLELDDTLKAHEGWWSTESRPGKYFIISKGPGGEKSYNSARTPTQRDAMVKRLSDLGHTDIGFRDKTKVGLNDTSDITGSALEAFQATEQKSWQKFLDSVKNAMLPDDYAELVKENGLYEPGQATEKQMAVRSIAKYLRPQEQTPGRENLDAFDTFEDYTRRLAATISRRSLRNQKDLMLNDPRVRNQGEFQQTVNNAVRVLLTPTHTGFRNVNAGITAFFLGFPNFFAPIVEGTQQLMFASYLNEHGDSVLGSAGRLARALVEVPKLARIQNKFEGKSLVTRARQKESMNPTSMTKDESMALYYQRALDDGILTHGVAQDLMLGQDQEALAQQALGTATNGPKSVAEMLGNGVYRAAKVSMIPYTMMTSYNNKSMFYAAMDLLYDQGKRGPELYNRAQDLMEKATYGGGKSNEVGYIRSLPDVFTNPMLQSSAKLVMLLQRYTLGTMTQMKGQIEGLLSTSKLPPGQRAAYGRALMISSGAFAALGGAMAMPGAAAACTIMEKVFGIDAKQAMRNLWYDIVHGLTHDDVISSTLANVAQNGISGQFLGADLSNRIAINGVMGFNSFDGFNTNNMFGVPFSLGENLVDATKYVAQGNLVQGFRTLAPPSMQKMIDLTAGAVQHQGVTGEYDQSGNLLMRTTPRENIMLGLGVAPYRYRLFRDRQHSLKLADQNAQQNAGGKMADAAGALLQGNNKPTIDWVREVMQKTPGLQPRETISAVVERAIKQTNEQDLLASGRSDTGPQRQAISETFGENDRQSEMKILMQREKLNAQTGYLGGEPVTGRQIQRAQMIDAIVKAKGVTRQQATRMATLLGF